MQLFVKARIKFQKASSHKYLKRWKDSKGKWRYEYPTDKKERISRDLFPSSEIQRMFSEQMKGIIKEFADNAVVDPKAVAKWITAGHEKPEVAMRLMQEAIANPNVTEEALSNNLYVPDTPILYALGYAVNQGIPISGAVKQLDYGWANVLRGFSDTDRYDDEFMLSQYEDYLMWAVDKYSPVESIIEEINKQLDHRSAIEAYQLVVAAFEQNVPIKNLQDEYVRAQGLRKDMAAYYDIDSERRMKVLKDGLMFGKLKLGGGINGSYRALLETDGTVVEAVWKPEAEAYTGNLRDSLPEYPGAQAFREELAYMADQAFGFGLVPMSTRHTDESGVSGSVQQFIPNATEAKKVGYEYWVSHDEYRFTLASIFDHLTGNTDRHPGNWMYDEEGGLHLIDNGLCLLEDASLGNEDLYYRALQERLSVEPEMVEKVREADLSSVYQALFNEEGMSGLKAALSMEIRRQGFTYLMDRMEPKEMSPALRMVNLYSHTLDPADIVMPQSLKGIFMHDAAGLVAESVKKLAGATGLSTEAIFEELGISA